MKDKGIDQTEAIKLLIRGEAISEEDIDKNREVFFEYPPFLFCDLHNTWFTKDTLLDPHNEAGCMNCEGFKEATCPAWRHRQLWGFRASSTPIKTKGR